MKKNNQLRRSGVMCPLSSRQTKKQKNLQIESILSSPPAAQRGEIFVTRWWRNNTRTVSCSSNASGSGACYKSEYNLQ